MKKLIDTALGEIPASLLLKNAQVINVFSGEIVNTNVAVADSTIAGVGPYTEGEKIVDLKGRYLLPGLIDAHIHIESSLLTPANFTAAIVPHGTTTIIADPHEIANVAGLTGVEYMVNASRDLPLDVFFMMPSCVPATSLETSGAFLDANTIKEAFRLYPQSLGLAEMMNFPGVIFKNEDVLEKIRTACNQNRLIDGHAPRLEGKKLNAYCGVGINTDHECTTSEEAREKLELGMHILVREGSAAKNLTELLPVINEYTWPYFSFCSDDRHPSDLVKEGSINYILRKAVAAGLDPITAVRIATINAARHYRLAKLGAIAPGYQADLVVVDNLTDFNVKEVYKKGRLVASDHVFLHSLVDINDSTILDTVHLPNLENKLKVTVPPGKKYARVIDVLPEQIITKNTCISTKNISSAEDISVIAVVERHGNNGQIAIGLVKGFGIKNGALASTVAHDSHNLILVGKDAQDMELAAHTIADMHGGLAVVREGKILASLALPVAGLMSRENVFTVAEQYDYLLQAAKETGCSLPSPFMTMSFLSLPVIPELKITDQGLIDAVCLEKTDLFF
ncbi:MAG: adenine deaminase [Desulfitobacteriaceae bacterium]|nr:adenine deaminase [Desulfitobacteriaceae bacterium]MDD4752932.1 adenine deaminase [Desulfitobacteriaceae bacterium]